ncbi:hypothetical protein SynBIOSE41_02738 [Synechococcus sp. BIOS-E4-1]|nr:hypothetical protein SynBIOSE41_02738 [Synechococcus sp. BIOS-E4-1]
MTALGPVALLSICYSSDEWKIHMYHLLNPRFMFAVLQDLPDG